MNWLITWGPMSMLLLMVWLYSAGVVALRRLGYHWWDLLAMASTILGVGLVFWAGLIRWRTEFGWEFQLLRFAIWLMPLSWIGCWLINWLRIPPETDGAPYTHTLNILLFRQPQASGNWRRLRGMLLGLVLLITGFSTTTLGLSTCYALDRWSAWSGCQHVIDLDEEMYAVRFDRQAQQIATDTGHEAVLIQRSNPSQQQRWNYDPSFGYRPGAGPTLSPDGTLIALMWNDTEIRVYRLGNTEPILQQRAVADVSSFTFSADNTLLAFTSYDRSYMNLSSGQFEVWRLSDGRRQLSGRNHGRDTPAKFSPDGRLIAVAGNDTRLDLWDVQTKSLVRSLALDRMPQYDFGPDGETVAVQAGDSIRLWQVADGAVRWEQTGLGLDIETSFALAWSPDGQQIVLANGTTILVFSSLDGRQVSKHTVVNPIDQIWFAADGTFVLLTHQTLQFWDCALAPMASGSASEPSACRMRL